MRPSSLYEHYTTNDEEENLLLRFFSGLKFLITIKIFNPEEQLKGGSVCPFARSKCTN